MNLQDVLDFIMTANQPAIEAVSDMTIQRHGMLFDQRARNLKCGDQVVLDNTEPEFLEGMCGVVTDMEYDEDGDLTAMVTLDASSTGILRFNREAREAGYACQANGLMEISVLAGCCVAAGPKCTGEYGTEQAQCQDASNVVPLRPPRNRTVAS